MGLGGSVSFDVGSIMEQNKSDQTRPGQIRAIQLAIGSWQYATPLLLVFESGLGNSNFCLAFDPIPVARRRAPAGTLKVSLVWIEE
jgi:hypothetical protein